MKFFTILFIILIVLILFIVFYIIFKQKGKIIEKIDSRKYLTDAGKLLIILNCSLIICISLFCILAFDKIEMFFIEKEVSDPFSVPISKTVEEINFVTLIEDIYNRFEEKEEEVYIYSVIPFILIELNPDNTIKDVNFTIGVYRKKILTVYHCEYTDGMLEYTYITLYRGDFDSLELNKFADLKNLISIFAQFDKNLYHQICDIHDPDQIYIRFFYNESITRKGITILNEEGYLCKTDELYYTGNYLKIEYSYLEEDQREDIPDDMRFYFSNYLDVYLFE